MGDRLHLASRPQPRWTLAEVNECCCFSNSSMIDTCLRIYVCRWRTLAMVVWIPSIFTFATGSALWCVRFFFLLLHFAPFVDFSFQLIYDVVWFAFVNRRSCLNWLPWRNWVGWNGAKKCVSTLSASTLLPRSRLICWPRCADVHLVQTGSSW